MSEPDGSTAGQNRDTFGSGVKRKRIEFVPPRSPVQSIGSDKTVNPSLSERYLSITLKKNEAPVASPAESAGGPDGFKSHGIDTENASKKSEVCTICRLPIQSDENEIATTSSSHELSLAHQVCAEHSYPPSHLDRDRRGLKYLASYGWDPDSRLGLGASGSGIRVPIKAKAKHDTVGLGVVLPEGKQKAGMLIEKLDAKKVRRLEAKNKKQREKLHQNFYGNDDVEKYLGTG